IEYFQSQRDFPMIDNTPASVTISALNVCAPLMPVLNNVTAYPAHQFALPMTFQQLNTEVKNIEIGVEQYNTHCENLVTFPTPADYAISTAQWINAANALWPIVLPNTHNNYKFAVSGNKPYEFNTERRTKWNEQVYPYLNNTAMLEGKYSIILHPYMGSGLSGLGVNNTTNINEMMVQPFQYYDNFLEKEIHQNIKPYGINHYFNTTKPDIWITEGNMFSKTGVVHGSWAAALFTGTLFLKMMEENQIKILDHHAMAGNFVWADYFNSNDGYITGDFDAPDVDGNTTNGLQVPTTVNLKGSLTLQGHVMRMIGSCFRNAAQAHLLNFTGVNMAVPSYTPIGTTAIYPMLYGWEFAASSATDNQILLLNLTDQPQSIDVSSFNFNAVNTLGYQLAFPFNSFLSDDNNGYYLHTYSTNSYTSTNSTPIYQQPLTWSNGYIILPAYSITKMQKCINTPPVLVASTTEPCNGLPFSIKVVNNKNYTGNYTWVSSNNASTTTTTEPVLVTNGITANTTYTVTVNICIGGTTSNSILIKAHTNLTANLTTNTSLPLCITGNAAQLTATLSGSSAFKSYAIYALDGADPAYVAPDVGYGNTNNSMFLTNVHPTATTQYQVTASDGVCAVTSPPIAITVVPKLEITPNVDQVCTGIYTDLAVDNTFTNVAWTGANIFGATTNPTVTINPATNTTYTVTATSNSCTQTVTKNITPVQCCTTANAYVMPAGTVLDNNFLNTPQSGLTIAKGGTNPIFYDISPGFPNTSITINDEISIDAAEDENAVVRFFLTNSTTPTTINMAERARVIVKPYNSVILKSTNVTACTNYLWRGFDIESYGSIQLDEQIPNSKPTISDAEYAIKLAHDSKWKITSADFLNNYVSIYIPPTNLAEVNNNTVSTLYNSNFTGNGTSYHTNYAGQTTPQFTYPYAGIILNDDALTLGNKNFNKLLFDKVNSGIMAYQTTMNVVNSQFTNIRLYNNVVWNLTAAIYFDGINRHSTLTQEGFGYTNLPFTFESCTQGITCNRASMTIFKNNMNNMAFGITASSSGFGDYINIHNCQIDCSARGITLLSTQNSEDIKISNNKLTTHNYNTWWANTGGILVSETPVKMADTKLPRIELRNNVIKLDNNSEFGIKIFGIERGWLCSNDITCSTNLPYAGIELNNVHNSSITLNTVAGNNATTSTTTGIRTILSPGNIFNGNTTTETKTGCYFDLDCSGTDFKGNKFGKHYDGLLFGPNIIWNSQIHKGNQWSDNLADYGNYAAYFTPALFQALSNQFVSNGIGTLCLPNTLFIPIVNGVKKYRPNTLSDGKDLFFPDPGAEYCSGTICEYPARIGEGGDETDHTIATGEVNTTTYTAEVNYSADQELVSRVHDNDSLQTADTTMANFYDQRMQTNIGRFDSISRLLGNSQNNAHKVSSIRYNDSLIQTYLTAINNFDMGNVVELKKIITYRNEIAALQLENNNLKSILTNDLIANATLAKNINDAIVSAEMIEDIEQQVWAVYIAMQIEQRKPNATELNIVLPIAQMCPAQGGRAVYIARTIFALVNDTIVYDDSAACANVGYNFKVIPFKNVAADRLFKISPNPTKENLN
ncbi:MAG TPA: hypothetical protein PK736_06875, partial [Bacteroidia bacterium]|nr:hypothetical protein [Bacteroidia bacterium]